MQNNENQFLALFLAFCCIGSVYGIILLFGMIFGLNS